MIAQHRTILSYFGYGALFGMLFPLTATGLDIWLRSLPASLASVGVVQSTQPLHWMIDSAPLFLGLLAALAGWRQERVERLNTQLGEQRVLLERALEQAERAEELARLNAENAQLYEQARRQLNELRQLAQEKQADQRTIRALLTPLIAVRDDVVALPLIGAFDVARLADLRSVALSGVEARRARTVILDCTGVTDMTPEAVGDLANTIDALALLGAEAIITGVTPALALRLVTSALGDRRLRTAADLAGGLALAQVPPAKFTANHNITA
jgi:rsbT co-antagonist protein RsbR